MKLSIPEPSYPLLLDFVARRVPFADAARGLVDFLSERRRGAAVSVIPGESGDPVQAPDWIPVFAGMTKWEKAVENSFRGRQVAEFTVFRSQGLWRQGDSPDTLLPRSTFVIAAHPET